MVLTGRFAAQSQTAAIIFLFVNILIYFVGASVCLKLWRHKVGLRWDGLAQEVRADWDTQFLCYMTYFASPFPMCLLCSKMKTSRSSLTISEVKSLSTVVENIIIPKGKCHSSFH